MGVSNMQQHVATITEVAGRYGIDMSQVLVHDCGDLQIGPDGGDTVVEQYGNGLWGVHRHGQQTCVTADFDVALVDAFRPLAAEGLFTSPASV